MKSIKVIPIVVSLMLAITINKSCQDTTPSSQAIRIVNRSNFIIDKILIQSNSQYLGFQNILPDSTTMYKYGQDILTSLKFIITVNNSEIRLDWKLPRQMNNYSNGDTFKSGEYEFSISNIEIDESNNDNSAIITLSDGSYSSK